MEKLFLSLGISAVIIANGWSHDAPEPHAASVKPHPTVKYEKKSIHDIIKYPCSCFRILWRVDFFTLQGATQQGWKKTPPEYMKAIAWVLNESEDSELVRLSGEIIKKPSTESRITVN